MNKFVIFEPQKNCLKPVAFSLNTTSTKSLASKDRLRKEKKKTAHKAKPLSWNWRRKGTRQEKVSEASHTTVLCNLSV